MIQESEPAEGEAKLDLFAGDFQANYPKADAPGYVLEAQGYLDSLTGNDGLFMENPDLKGRELVRLMGIENADKVVAQSQFALRYMGGGATGGGFARALTSGGGFGVGGFGATGGGTSAGAGGGGGLIAPTGSNSGSSIPSTTPVTTTPTTTNNPPTNTPPTTTGSTPPTNGPDTPTNPVPAPAGLLLGFIALGTLGSWRIGARVLGTK